MAATFAGDQMKAVYVSEQHKLEIIELPKPKLQRDDEVLLRITSAGICSSDLEIAAGMHPFARYPMIIGHEFGGVVEEIGAKVSKVHTGSRVTVDPVTSCGHCHSCLRGKENVCLNLATMGVHRNGGFAQYVVVPEKNVYPFKSSDADESILGLAEPYSVGVQINFRAQVSSRDRVLILGSGPIGICAMQEARFRGAEVSMTDLIGQRLERAKHMGADCTVNAGKTDVTVWAKEYYEGCGADVVVDTVGTPSSMLQAMELVAFGGTIVTVSLDKRPTAIQQSEITRKEMTVTGSRLNLRHFAHVVENMEAGWFQANLLRSHTFHFTQIKEALDLIHNHPEEVCKVTLRFD